MQPNQKVLSSCIHISLIHNRYGKPFVMDMMEVDMFETVSDRFDEIKKGLMDDIMDRSILQEEK